MQLVKFNKQMQQQYAVYRYAYNFNTKDSIYQAYVNPSYNKVRAFNYCMDLYHKYKGYDFTIIGNNCHTFSVGFCYDDDNGNKHFVWITKSYDRDCIVE